MITSLLLQVRQADWKGPMRRPRARAPRLERLEDRVAPAGNILQVDPDWINPTRINEWTLSGTKVRSIDAPDPTEFGVHELRDLIVDPNGDIQLFHNTFHPYLATYHQATGTWTSRTTDMWSTVNNGTYGGIA